MSRIHFGTEYSVLPGHPPVYEWDDNMDPDVQFYDILAAAFRKYSGRTIENILSYEIIFSSSYRSSPRIRGLTWHRGYLVLCKCCGRPTNLQKMDLACSDECKFDLVHLL